MPAAAAAGEPPAADADLVVTWTGSTECDGSERLRERITADLGSAVPPTGVDVVVVDDDGALRGELTLRGPSVLRRSIAASDCEALADALAIVTVVALDPFVIVARMDPAPIVPTQRPTPIAPPAVASRPAVAPPPAIGSRPRPPIHAALRLELGASAFALPGLGAVLGVAPLFDRGRLRFEAPLRWSLPRQHTIRTGIGGRLQLVSVGPRACFVPGRGPIGVLLCGGLDLGAMIATGRGRALVRTTTAVQPWVAAVAAVGLRWRVHPRFATWLALEGAVPFARPAFHVVDDADVHRAGRATIAFAIGGELHFPPSARPSRRTQSSDRTMVRGAHVLSHRDR